MKDIKIIFTNGENELGVDENNILYWNKKIIQTENKVVLDFWVNLSVIVASISTFVMAIIAVLQRFNF